MNTLNELQTCTGIEAVDPPNQDYFVALVKSTGKLAPDAWEEISESSQRWVNLGLFCLEKNKEIPAPDDASKLAILQMEMEADDAARESKKAAKPQKASKSNGAAGEPASAPEKKKAAAKSKPAKVAKEKEAKATPAKKPAKTPVKAKEKEGESRGRKGTYPLNAKIKILVKENPHRSGTVLHKYFAKYKAGMTVEAALAAGIVWANLRYLSSRNIISIS